MFKKCDLMTAHRDKTQQLKTDQNKLSAIQRMLFEDYETAQSSCDFCLPGQLNDIVETTVNSYNKKYGGGPSEPENVLDMLADIMQLSQAFNLVTPNIVPPQLRKEFKGRSNSEIMDKLIALDRQLMHLQETLRKYEAKMKLLQTTFNSCQSDFYCFRNRKLKTVIMEVTCDVTEDPSQSATDGNSTVATSPLW
ncbi:hypothetical protein LSAT2_001690 [Lamellibrachia satsuma]|nr:hypothetical protein LSAT2_001690 [Lamellibrachia satsuma]